MIVALADRDPEHSVDKDRNVHPTVFDIPIEIEDPHKTKMHAAVQSLEAGSTLEGIMAAEDEVAALAHQIRTGREKRDFLNGFAQDPAGFINRWMASQARDLDIVLGNEIGLPGTNGGLVREEDLRRSDLFRMPWVSLGRLCTKMRSLIPRPRISGRRSCYRQGGYPCCTGSRGGQGDGEKTRSSENERSPWRPPLRQGGR